ncbi:MAG: lipoyl domain-containing protein [Planctomycetaceae bacterium]|nr:lipoyl domain-containing protein [Planctomycetaceae bacterium]
MKSLTRPLDCNPQNLVPISVPNPGIGDEQVCNSDSQRQRFQGELTAWYVEPESKIQADDLLFQVSWPGLAFDVAAPCDGVLLKKCAQLRDAVHPGKVVAYVDSSQQ